MMKRAYYSEEIVNFIKETDESILGKLVKYHRYQSLEISQNNAWKKQIEILKRELIGLNGFIYFEFSIPRMEKRIDNIVILGNKIFLIEFKTGSNSYNKDAQEQVIDYALDLRNFHEGSHNAILIPILVSEFAPNIENDLVQACALKQAICLNSKKLGEFLQSNYSNNKMDILSWEKSGYRPTPTIVEAAQALYRNHNVDEITRSDSGAENLSITCQRISNLIEEAKNRREKLICFITGVPGAGKTLAGLNIANQRLRVSEKEHTVFLSGNGPLVTVLQKALAGNIPGKSKMQALKETKTFIQNIHHFRDEYLDKFEAPLEKVVIFDEAQRAWDKNQATKFMQQKRGKLDFSKSEPEFLIEVMNRHQDWCVIICLIGGGQEINTGEAGLEEWCRALKEHYLHWEICYSPLIVNESIYLQDKSIINWLIQHGKKENNLHLSTSIRSFRSEKVSAFIQSLLDITDEVTNLYTDIKEHYYIVMTRDITKAKQWLLQNARGTERYGVIASSGARRLKALGVNVKSGLEVDKWFLNNKDDVRSSYFLEDIGTEFDVQGLELDWVCIGWDANFYFNKDKWCYQNFKGTTWQKVNKEEDRKYIKNAYRVLLTRARQGIVIWIPEGSESDLTRKKEFYDHTYSYLKSIGIEELQ